MKVWVGADAGTGRIDKTIWIESGKNMFHVVERVEGEIEVWLDTDILNQKLAVVPIASNGFLVKVLKER